MKPIQGRILIITYGALLLLSACNSPEPQQSAPESVAITPEIPVVPGDPTPTPSPSTTPNPPTSPTPSPSPKPSLADALGINVSVDLRAYDGPIRQQFGGTCSAFATAAAMNNVLKQKGINKLVSERHLWDSYGLYDMDYAVDAASSTYLTEDKYWPSNSTYPVSDFYEDYASLKITQFKSHEYNFNSALQGLSKGHPLVMAVQVPSDLGDCKKTISANSYATSGEHVLEAVGYKLDDSVSGGGYFILKNSWGSGCGDKGYHYYPFSLCKRSDLYCYFTEVIDVEDRAR